MVKPGKNYPKAERNTKDKFKVIQSNTEIAITPPQIARLNSNLTIRCKCSRSKVKGQRSRSRG